MSELTRTVATRQTINPKTVLGFYATVLALILAGTIALTATIATTGEMTSVIPWMLGFSGSVIILLILAVFYINISDPAKLMLGQVSGQEYAVINRITLGDSLTGEHSQVAQHIFLSDAQNVMPVIAMGDENSSPTQPVSSESLQNPEEGQE